MEVLKFTLQGKTGFFKKPDVNSYLYFTYGNIHKVALLGMFGAILGYRGYNQMSFENKYKKDFKDLIKNDCTVYPEFYMKLKDIKVAIIPRDVSISKKIQVYNNSVGYASKEQGGNLIIKEQWLENPCWDICVLMDSKESKDLADAIMQNKFVFLPYLGKNDHPADIKDCSIVQCEIKDADEYKIDSLFIKDNFEIREKDEFDFFDTEEELIFKYQEKLPHSLEESTNKYNFKTFLFTNSSVGKINDTDVYRVEEKTVMFF